MPTTKTGRIALACAVTYIFAMGLSNTIVYHAFHVSYNDAGYAKAMLPFLSLLMLGTLACFAVMRRQLTPTPGGPGRYGLFFILFIPVVGMTVYHWFTNASLGSAFLVPLIAALLVGIAEETMFRRILYVGLLREPHGAEIKGALLISAIVFSLLHAVNLLAGLPFPNMLAQLASTFIAGLFYALMYDYTKSISLMIAAHSLWDYLLLSGATAKVPAFGIVVTALNVVQFALMLALLIRKRKQDSVPVHGH